MVSLILPQLDAGQTLTLEFLAGGPNYNATWLTKEQLLASDFEALLAVTVGISTTNVSARQMLQNLGTVDTWVKGGICHGVHHPRLEQPRGRRAQRLLPRARVPEHRRHPRLDRRG